MYLCPVAKNILKITFKMAKPANNILLIILLALIA